MDENKDLFGLPPTRTGKNLLSGISVVCAALILSGCGMDILPTRSMEGDIENAKSHMRNAKKSKKASRKEIEEALAKNPQPVTPPPLGIPEADFQPLNTAQKTIYTDNPKNLFGTDLRTPEERLDRLERAVQDMRNDFNNVRPAVRRLMGIETEMQSLIKELQKLNNDSYTTSIPNNMNTAQRTQKPAPVKKIITPKAPAKTMSIKSPPPLQGQPSVYDMRIGEHTGKTRIVLDVNAKTSFSVDVDNGEKIMIIELPNAKWSASKSKRFSAKSIIKSFTIEPAGSGTLAIFQLKRGAKIGYKADLAGTKGTSRRIVIDLVNG